MYTAAVFVQYKKYKPVTNNCFVEDGTKQPDYRQEEHLIQCKPCRSVLTDHRLLHQGYARWKEYTH